MRMAILHKFYCSSLSCFIPDCVVYQSIFIPRVGLTSSPDDPTYNVTHDSCVMIDDLGRFALKEFDFNVTFALSDRAIFPKPEPFNTLFVPDVTTIVTHFHVDAYEDIGGTLKVSIAALNPTVMVSQFNQFPTYHINCHLLSSAFVL